MNPQPNICSVCRKPLYSWENAGGKCLGCADAIVIETTKEDVETAMRQFVCATHPELATGYVIDVHAATVVAYRPND